MRSTKPREHRRQVVGYIGGLVVKLDVECFEGQRNIEDCDNFVG